MATSTWPAPWAASSSSVMAARVADFSDVGFAAIVSTRSRPRGGP